MYVSWIKPDVTGCEQVCEQNSLSMACTYIHVLTSPKKGGLSYCSSKPLLLTAHADCGGSDFSARVSMTQVHEVLEWRIITC